MLTAHVSAAYSIPSPGTAAADVGLETGGIGAGTGLFGNIFANVTNAFVSGTAFNALIVGVASLVIVRAALLLIAEQSEGELGKFKTAIVSAIVAIVMIAIAKPISGALFGSSDLLSTPGTAANTISDELLEIVELIEEPIAVLAIIMIIVSGIRTVLSYGDSDGVSHIRKTIISVLIGIFLIVTKEAFKSSIADKSSSDFGSPDAIITKIIEIFNIILGFVTIVAVAVIIFAGFLMIVNIGKDEQYSKAKGIIIRVAIGLIVILTAAAIANVFLV